MRNLISATASAALLLGLGLAVTAAPTASQAQISIGIGFGGGGVSVGFAPPALPVYEQPPIPAYGYIWTPGYWAWDDSIADYYWVPGTWVLPARPGYLWTPAYWGWNNGAFVFNSGYWGPHVGFYGGVNYGYGYGSNGYEGGEWRGGRFFYNSSANNFRGARITNVYRGPVTTNITVNNVSYNGGAGGVAARPTPAQVAAARETHVPPTKTQVQHRTEAAAVKGNRASVNGGKPAIAATSKPGTFKGPGVVTATKASAPFKAPPAAERAKVVAAHKAAGKSVTATKPTVTTTKPVVTKPATGVTKPATGVKPVVKPITTAHPTTTSKTPEMRKAPTTTGPGHTVTATHTTSKTPEMRKATTTTGPGHTVTPTHTTSRTPEMRKATTPVAPTHAVTPVHPATTAHPAPHPAAKEEKPK